MTDCERMNNLVSAPELIVPTMLPLKEVSSRTNLRYEFLRQLCLNGEIVHVRTGNKYLINYEKFLEYLNGNKGGENNAQR